MSSATLLTHWRRLLRLPGLPSTRSAGAPANLLHVHKRHRSAGAGADAAVAASGDGGAGGVERQPVPGAPARPLRNCRNRRFSGGGNHNNYDSNYRSFRPRIHAAGFSSTSAGHGDRDSPDENQTSPQAPSRPSFLHRLREAVFDSEADHKGASPPASGTTNDKASSRTAATTDTGRHITPSRAAKHRMHTRKLARTVMDVEPVASSDAKGSDVRLEWIKLDHNEEFPRMTKTDKTRRNLEASKRILTIAYERVFEPRIVKIVLGSCGAVVTLGFAEASLLCNELPFLPVSEISAVSNSINTGLFCLRYALEQVVHSCIWSTQDASLIATAMGFDPDTLLRTFDPKSATDAATQLRVQMLATSRSIVAGFMLLAQLVRAVNISANAAKVYEARIRQGLEPPLLEGVDQRVVRLCGVGSDATAVSLYRSGAHIFPVFEDASRVAHLVEDYSDNGRSPMMWCVRPQYYGYGFSWKNFPVDEDCFIHSSTGRNILCLEADATNSDDPLSLGDQALDLTIDDASQGFRRIQQLYKEGKEAGQVPPFRTLRVFLGNSLEEARSGGGYSYTLRHRVRYAKEVDVLIDSRAPVLQEVLRWCDRVAGKDRRVLFQTSSRKYFLNLQLLMRRYGYEIYDPLDLRMLEELRRGEEKSQAEAAAARKNAQDADAAKACKEDDANEDEESGPFMSLLHQILLDDLPMTKGPSDADASAGTLMQDYGDGDEDRKDGGDTAQSYATALSRMPRLVYYETTAETVNAVQALVTAGEADAGNCCALIDKQEGVSFLESVLRRKPGLQAKRAQEQRVRDMKAEMNDMVYEEVHALTKGDRQRQERAKRKRQSLADALDQRADDSSSSPANSASASPAASSETKSHRVARSGESGASHQPSAADSLDLLKESWTGDRLHIICSSVIYDELFRQVRQWAREGNSTTSIQKELDLRFQDVITQSIEVRDTVAEVAAKIVAEEKEFLQKAKMEKARADAEKEAAAAAASAVISSDGESGGAESQEFAEGVGAAGDGGERLEGAPLVREESTVEKSAMATLAAKEQAEVLQSHTNKSGKKKK